jgi:hypothetical protein
MIELQNEDNKNVKINVKNRKLLKGGVYGFWWNLYENYWLFFITYYRAMFDKVVGVFRH